MRNDETAGLTGDTLEDNKTVNRVSKVKMAKGSGKSKKRRRMKKCDAIYACNVLHQVNSGIDISSKTI